jgi:hypothetical protein
MAPVLKSSLLGPGAVQSYEVPVEYVREAVIELKRHPEVYELFRAMFPHFDGAYQAAADEIGEEAEGQFLITALAFTAALFVGAGCWKCATPGNERRMRDLMIEQFGHWLKMLIPDKPKKVTIQ